MTTTSSPSWVSWWEISISGSPAVPPGVEWPRSQGGTGHYYDHWASFRGDWITAVAAAEQEDFWIGQWQHWVGHLATFETQAENDFAFLNTLAASGRCAWIGLQKDPGGSGQRGVHWPEWSPVGYHNWEPNEPEINDANAIMCQTGEWRGLTTNTILADGGLLIEYELESEIVVGCQDTVFMNPGESALLTFHVANCGPLDSFIYTISGGPDLTFALDESPGTYQSSIAGLTEMPTDSVLPLKVWTRVSPTATPSGLLQIDFSSIPISNLAENYPCSVMVQLSDTPVAVRTISAQVPSLHPNYPNPFNPTTTLSFYLPASSFTKLAIYDTAGRLVAVLVDSHRQEGTHEVVWGGVDRTGNTVSSGIYFARLVAGDFSETRKMVLLK